jgi:hypothetical protein
MLLPIIRRYSLYIYSNWFRSTCDEPLLSGHKCTCYTFKWLAAGWVRMELEIFLVIILVSGWVDPSVIVRPQWLCQWTIPMTPSRIEPTTCRLVTGCLDQLRRRVPLICDNTYYIVHVHFERDMERNALTSQWLTSYSSVNFTPILFCDSSSRNGTPSYTEGYLYTFFTGLTVTFVVSWPKGKKCWRLSNEKLNPLTPNDL